MLCGGSCLLQLTFGHVEQGHIVMNGGVKRLRTLNVFGFLCQSQISVQRGVHDFERLKTSPASLLIGGGHRGGVIQQTLHQCVVLQFLGKWNESESEGGVDAVHRASTGQHIEDLKGHFRRHVCVHGITSNGAQAATVYGQTHTSDSTRCGEAEVRDGAGGFKRVDEPADGDLSQPPLSNGLGGFARSFLDRRREIAESFGVRESRKDVVDGDAGGQFVGHGFGPGGHGSTEGVREADVGNGFLDRGGDDLDDSSVACGLHVRDSRLDEGVGSVKVAPERGVKVLDDIVQKWTAGWSACIVDENVNGAQGFSSRCEGTGQPLGFFEIQHEGLVPSTAKACEFFAQRGQRCAISGAYGDVSSSLGHHFGRCFTDAFAGTANKGVLPFEGG